MARLRTKKLVVGMVLSRDVYDTSGRLLVKKGTVIEDKHLKVFNTWGVAEVDVESEADAVDEECIEIPAEYIEKASSQIRHNLLHNDIEHELISEIFNIAVDRLALHLMNEDKA